MRLGICQAHSKNAGRHAATLFKLVGLLAACGGAWPSHVYAQNKNDRYLSTATYLCKSIDGLQHRQAGAPALDCTDVPRFTKVIFIRFARSPDGDPTGLTVVSYQGEDWLSKWGCFEPSNDMDALLRAGGACLISASNEDEVKGTAFDKINTQLSGASNDYNRLDTVTWKLQGSSIHEGIPYCSQYQGRPAEARWKCEGPWDGQLKTLKAKLEKSAEYIDAAKAMPGGETDEERETTRLLFQLQAQADADTKLLARYRGIGKPLAP